MIEISLELKGIQKRSVSENGGTPKSSILPGFSLINQPFGGTTIFRKPPCSSHGDQEICWALRPPGKVALNIGGLKSLKNCSPNDTSSSHHPLVDKHNYGKQSFLWVNQPLMAILNSKLLVTVSLPEGIIFSLGICEGFFPTPNCQRKRAPRARTGRPTSPRHSWKIIKTSAIADATANTLPKQHVGLSEKRVPLSIGVSLKMGISKNGLLWMENIHDWGVALFQETTKLAGESACSPFK